jgi:hypothetical protein
MPVEHDLLIRGTAVIDLEALGRVTGGGGPTHEERMRDLVENLRDEKGLPTGRTLWKDHHGGFIVRWTVDGQGYARPAHRSGKVLD